MKQDQVIRTLVSERAKLLAYAWSVLRDRHAVEDVFQEVMLLAVQKCDDIVNDRALMAWARTAIRYRALHEIRDRKNVSQPFSDGMLDALDECWERHDETAASDMSDALQSCVDQLSPYARQVIALRYREGRSGIEVAEALKRNVRTIYMALTRIHNSLRHCIRAKLAADS